MKRVLIIRSGAVGDLILTLPVLSALKQRYDGLSIDMMGDPDRLSLLKHCGYVDKVLPIDDREFTPLFAPGGPSGPGGAPSGSVPRKLPDHLIRRLRSYDLMLSYVPDPDGVFAENLRRIASGPVLTGRSRPPAEDDRIHMTRVLMDALKPLGVGTSVDTPSIALRSSTAPADVRILPSNPVTEDVRDLPLNSEIEDARNRPSSTAPKEVRNRPSSVETEEAQNRPSDENLIAIHPGSGGSAKCWPAERYVALIECLVEGGYRPVVTFGPADDAVRRRILPRINGRDVLIAEGLPLLEMADLYARCRAMIGNDSGMTHLAAATGTPVIALFGPTDPAVWGPRGKDVRILWGTDVFEGDVDCINWQGPFRPRSLDGIEPTAPLRILSGIFAAAGANRK